MKINVLIKNLFILYCLVFHSVGNAYPNMNYYIQGSSFFVRASNPDNRTWNCSISYTLNYDDFGTPAHRDFSKTFVVNINYNGIVLNHQTTWPASSLTVSNVSGPNCS